MVSHEPVIPLVVPDDTAGTNLEPPKQGAAKHGRARRPRRKIAVSVWVTAACWMLGVLVLLYPTASAWITQYNQSKLIRSYEEQVRTVDPDAAEQLKNAYAYNERLSSGVLLATGANVPVGVGDSRGQDAVPYAQQLTTPSGMMARLKIPSIDVDLPIFHGTSEDTLFQGLGHLEGTSLPVGGESTRSVITGHRGLASARMFTDLDRVKEGDVFTIETFGQVLTYRVNDVTVVKPEQTETLHQIPGKDLVTLITCTPLGINSHRILVTGERITPTPKAILDDAGKPSTVPHFPWWIVAVIGAAAAAAAYVRRASRPPKTSIGQRLPAS